MTTDTFRSPQAKAERQRRYAELRDEGTDPGTAAGQVGITAHRAAEKYERVYQAGKDTTPPPPAQDEDTPDIRLVAEPPEDWLAKRLGPLPEGVTQEQRDRDMPLVHATATELIGDHWKRPILPFIAARQCARFGGDKTGARELLEYCGLIGEPGPMTGYRPKARKKGGGK